MVRESDIDMSCVLFPPSAMLLGVSIVMSIVVLVVLTAIVLILVVLACRYGQ